MAYKIKYEQLENYAKQLATYTEAIIECTKKMRTAVQNAEKSGYWQGGGYNYYKSKFENMAISFQLYCMETIKPLNNSILDSIERHKSAEQKLKLNSPVSGR